MSEVLSQSEIDKLFAQMTAGELNVQEIKETASEKVVKVYDFARPSKFSKDHLRTLEIIFENYSRTISNYLSGYLRTIVPIEVISAEALTFHEFSNSLPNPLLLGIVDVKPLKGSIIIEMAPGLGFSIIDKILGGKGIPLNKIREFTNIERIILQKVFEQFAELFSESWKNVVEIESNLDKVETNPQVVQIISPSEMIALITLNVTIGETQGMINICIPHLVIEPIMDRLNTKHWFTHGGSQVSDEVVNSTEVQKALEDTTVKVRAVLGEATVNAFDILNIERGDVIKLNSATTSEIQVYVEELLKFTASPGCQKNKKAIRINTVIKGEE